MSSASQGQEIAIQPRTLASSALSEHLWLVQLHLNEAVTEAQPSVLVSGTSFCYLELAQGDDSLNPLIGEGRRLQF